MMKREDFSDWVGAAAYMIFPGFQRQLRKTWALDRLGLQRALQHFNLQRYVDIQFSSKQYGEYLPEASTLDKHFITIDPFLPTDGASLILWHELTHCQQVEKFGGSAMAWWEQCLDSAGKHVISYYDYLNTPWEKEAYGSMVLHFDVGPLTYALENK